jgi:hypothetical protein
MFKYLKLLGMWKDVREVYQEEKGADKPWYVSRRFFGAVVVFIGGALYAFFDVALPADLTDTMADNAAVIGGLVKDLVPAAVALYGAATSLVGILKKSAKGGK